MSDDQKRDAFILTMIASVLIAGFIFGGIGWFYVAHSAFVKSWPTADGTIQSSSARSDIERMRGRKSGGGDQERSHVSVSYEYSVEGRTFVGDRISPRPTGSMGIESANALVFRYPKGQAVEVYYSATDPKQAFLDPTSSWNTVMTAILGSIAFLFGLAGLPLAKKSLFNLLASLR